MKRWRQYADIFLMPARNRHTCDDDMILCGQSSRTRRFPHDYGQSAYYSSTARAWCIIDRRAHSVANSALMAGDIGMNYHDGQTARDADDIFISGVIDCALQPQEQYDAFKRSSLIDFTGIMSRGIWAEIFYDATAAPELYSPRQSIDWPTWAVRRKVKPAPGDTYEHGAHHGA